MNTCIYIAPVKQKSSEALPLTFLKGITWTTVWDTDLVPIDHL